MTPVQPFGIAAPESSSITELFHRVNRLLPDDQVVFTVPPDLKASEAIKQMTEQGFSQAPVIEGNEVLGIFSFRSFSQAVVKMGKDRVAPGDLPVDEFIEKVHFAHVTDEFSSLFDHLDRDNAVLVGEPSRLQGIVTAMDVLRYLYGVASPYVLLAEIELALRMLFTVSVNGPDLMECAQNSLKDIYVEDRLPGKLEEMTFNDYVQIVGHGQNWSKFEGVFGGTRERTWAKLAQVRDMRNDIFHFRRALSLQDYEALVSHRDWILTKARIAEARNTGR